MDDSAYSQVLAELRANEHLLWQGKPRGGIKFYPADVFLVPFSLLWGGFAIFFEAMAILHGAPFFFWIFGAGFVLVGLYIIFGRFIIDSLRRDHTSYGLTDKRIIIVSGIVSRNVKSIDLDKLGEINIKESGDGSGDINFGPQSLFSSAFDNIFGPRYSWQGVWTAPSLEFIDQVRVVYDLIAQAQAK